MVTKYNFVHILWYLWAIMADMYFIKLHFEIIKFIQQGCIKLIKSDVNTFIMLKNTSISNKLCSSKNPE